MTANTNTIPAAPGRRARKQRVAYASAADRDAAARIVAPAANPEARAVIVSSGPGHVTAALVVPSRKRAARPVDPVEQQVRVLLKVAMRIVARLAGQIPDIAKLRGSTSGEILHRLANGPGGKTGVPDDMVDTVETVVGWVRQFVTDPIAQRLVLAWATGASWADLVEADPLGRQRWQLNQILGAGVRGIAAGLREAGREKEVAQTTQILI